MKVNDLIRMCFQNLRRRKSRTILTMLGVVIGCCSIVIMVSIGIGMNEAQQKSLSEMGDLTLITVYSMGSSEEFAQLNAAAVKQFQEMDGVLLATGKLQASMPVRLFSGVNDRYRSEYCSVFGMDLNSLEKLGYQLNEGSFPTDKKSVLVGQYFAYSFSDTKRPDGYNMIYDYYSEDPYFPALNASFTMEISTDNGEKKFTEDYTACGVMMEDWSRGYETYQGVVMDIDTLQKLIDRYNRENGRAANKEPTYDSILVKVEDISQVAGVEEQIQDLGYSTSSMESIRKPMEENARQQQMMFGGLGAIALLVAALGITNTMIMSISERTREIGIMKSLGCYVSDIRTMFLMEAGMIGFMGGVVGIIFSELISVGMNLFSVKDTLTGPESIIPALTAVGSRMSVIPVWLLLFALVFSVFIGLGSGYYPANKAVKIPALEAIKQ